MQTDALRKLLFLPAPAPGTAEAAKDAEVENQRPAKFYARDNAPPDDATAEDLLDYWSRWAGTQDSPKPSIAVSLRLLAACEAEPESLSRLLPLLPDNAAAAERVKKLYDEAQNANQFDDDWRKSVRKWLLFNSKYFVGELMSSASKAKDDDSHVDKQEFLESLAKVDWPGAEPLLQRLSSGGSGPRTAVLAMALLHRHAIEAKNKIDEEKYRERLQAIASDRNAPARARDTAIEELSLTEWIGRDEWYLSLFVDETLLQPDDGSTAFSPLSTLFYQDPDKWIPVMTKLVESKNRAVQQAAASCLVQYATNHPRRDAALPVLRWLSDPDWLNISGTYRAWFMQKMDELDMPESVPGLIWIIENDEGHRHYAARTIAQYKDPRAVPALKKALAQENDESDRQMIIQGLLACGGLSEAEQIATLETYAAKLTTKGGREEVERYRSYGDDPLPVAVSIGRHVAGQEDVPGSLVTQVLARAEHLQRIDPALSRALLEIAQGWKARQVDLDLLQRISAGAADTEMIANALERRERLRISAGPQLQTLAGTVGASQGIAAVLLADEPLAESLLRAEDQLAQIALLACARLTQMALPIAQVGPLLRSKNPTLALAAERYLLAEDSKEAQQLLLAHHTDKAFITGWRESISLIGGNDFDAIGKVEEKLRAELLKESAPLEIFALLANHEHYHRVVRVYRDRAIYTYYEDGARYRERAIRPEELAQLRSFITNNHLMELGPQLSYCHHDCSASELLLLTKQGGRRVFSHQGAFAWITLSDSFNSLGRGDGSKVHYYLEKEIKGLEVLHVDEELSVRDVWQQGADLRVLVERKETLEEIAQSQKADDTDDEEDEEAARAERRRQAAARKRARFSWNAFSQGKPSAVTAQPEGYSTFDEGAFDIDEGSFGLNEHLAHAVTGNSVVLAGAFGESGLWKKAVGGKAVRISGEGAYASPLVTPDGKWVVAAKTDSDWSKPNYIVRFNLQTRREYRVNLPPADQFDSVAYVAAHGKVLLRRARDENNSDTRSAGPVAPEFYLLDVGTGQTQLVMGVFAPLQESGRRFLQPTGKPFEFWAAIPDRSKNQTRVGRYNLKDFSFELQLVVPQLIFDSLEMWVNESGSSLYIVYDGQLLRLPSRGMS
ncbi:MAG TPA: HEAT repeat domain-containing protein [Blastocatellia bacterium]|nr:HEAT repeat domain-containing protein [Blastocatellia bacterium]